MSAIWSQVCDANLFTIIVTRNEIQPDYVAIAYYDGIYINTLPFPGVFKRSKGNGNVIDRDFAYHWCSATGFSVETARVDTETGKGRVMFKPFDSEGNGSSRIN